MALFSYPHCSVIKYLTTPVEGVYLKHYKITIITMTKETNIVEFLTTRFLDEASATAFFAEKRWGKDVHCPYCTSERVYKLSLIHI